MAVYDGPVYRHPECADGCQLSRARVLFSQAQGMLDQAQRLTGRTTEGEIVSQALWCDQGNHAFSARDLKAEHWERRIKDADGDPVVVPWDVCGPCLSRMGPAQAALPANAEAMTDGG